MMQVRLTADVTLLANLRQLSLGRTSTTLTFRQLREVLTLNPRLEKLALYEIIDRFADWHTVTSAHAEKPTPITLPHLVSFLLEEHSPAVTSAFVSQLCLPAVRYVYLQGRIDSGAAADLNLGHTGDLGSSNAPSWPAMLLPPHAIRAVSPLLMCSAATSATLEVNHHKYELMVTDDAGGTLYLELIAVGFNHTPRINVGLAGLLHGCGAAARIERLTLFNRGDENDGMTREEWGAVLGAFPALEELNLSWSGDMEPLWTTLRGDGDGAAGLGVLPCPRLKHVDYSASIGLQTHFDRWDAGVRALVECCEQRLRRGSRLRMLDFLVRTGLGPYPQDYADNERGYLRRLTGVVDELQYWCTHYDSIPHVLSGGRFDFPYFSHSHFDES
ncbi:hypothetical protein C2E23DRAFT_885465 [Lenzites betulinus]|nr:hypothetical protein C2E23DRAFT_885465 [Lenzites betulinus]